MLITVDQQHVLNFMKSAIEDMGWRVSNPQWASSDESVATVTPSEDGWSGNVVAQGEGAVLITCTATIDQGNGNVYEQVAVDAIGVLSAAGAMALEETTTIAKD